MTLRQPHLGDPRHQELRNSPFWPTPLFRSQLVKDGQHFLLKKGTPKDSQGFGPYQNKPFRGPHHNRKRGSYRKSPCGAIPPKAVINRFPPVGGNRTTEASEVIFDPIQGDEGMETPLPNDYVLPFISKPNLVRAPLIQSGYRALQKDQALVSCIQSLLSKNTIERVENVKSQASPKVEASNRLQQAQHLPTCRKVQNGNTRVHQDLSDYRGMGVIDRSIRRLPSHPPSTQTQGRFCHKSQVFQFTSLPFGLATAPQTDLSQVVNSSCRSISHSSEP